MSKSELDFRMGLLLGAIGGIEASCFIRGALGAQISFADNVIMAACGLAGLTVVVVFLAAIWIEFRK